MRLQADIGGGQMRALVGAGQLLGDGDYKNLIPRRGGFLIRLHKGGRAGLAGAGQLAVLGQPGKELVLRHAAVILAAGSVRKGDGHGHNGDTGGGQLRRSQIGGRIGDNTNHRFAPLWKAAGPHILLTIQ